MFFFYPFRNEVVLENFYKDVEEDELDSFFEKHNNIVIAFLGDQDDALSL